MKFSLLLYVLKRKLNKAAKKSAEFKEHLKQKDFTLVIKTEDGRKARFFTFRNGDVISASGDNAQANISLVWKDAATGFSVMASGSNDALMKAVQNGLLKIQGDGQLALVFGGIMKKMMKALT